MADNNTSNTSPQHIDDLVGVSWMNIIRWILFALNLAAAIYGVTSWCIIKKFRHFRNYVVLSAIIVKAIFFFSNHVIIKIQLTKYKFIQNEALLFFKFVLVMYLTISYHCWLVVLCYIFYVDFVKVFRLDIRRRYLKSSLFALGLPLISNLLIYVPGLYVFFFVSKTRTTYELLDAVTTPMLLMPVVIRFVIYIRVLYYICRVSEAGVSTSFNKWRRFYIASLIFLLSNVIVFPFIAALFGVHITLTIVIIMELGAMLNIIALPVYFIILKSNRELWREFLYKRSTQKSLELDIRLQHQK